MRTRVSGHVRRLDGGFWNRRRLVGLRVWRVRSSIGFHRWSLAAPQHARGEELAILLGIASVVFGPAGVSRSSLSLESAADRCGHDQPRHDVVRIQMLAWAMWTLAGQRWVLRLPASSSRAEFAQLTLARRNRMVLHHLRHPVREKRTDDLRVRVEQLDCIPRPSTSR